METEHNANKHSLHNTKLRLVSHVSMACCTLPGFHTPRSRDLRYQTLGNNRIGTTKLDATPTMKTIQEYSFTAKPRRDSSSTNEDQKVLNKTLTARTVPKYCVTQNKVKASVPMSQRNEELMRENATLKEEIKCLQKERDDLNNIFNRLRLEVILFIIDKRNKK